jgi:phosphoribosylformylglycinamidine cyclo-ligase
MAKATYKSSGVDLDQYEQAMKKLPHWMHRTHSPRVMQLDGGFAGLFQLDFAGQLFARSYENPVLVACTDGVGTKLKVATAANRHDTVGVDLVAMCVNDAICCGAESLFFLDYVAMSKDDPVLLEQVVSGISNGCVQADSALLGGETAIMPDLYAPGEYDLAGFSVGVVEKSRVIDGTAIEVGDVLIGIASSGLHSNGFSLVRKIVFDIARLTCDDHVDELGANVGDLLLEPTRIYVQLMRAVFQHYRVKNVVHGIAHITGGGLLENVSRILPKGRHAVVERDSWTVPPVFHWLQKLGDVDADEMDRVFNRGIGLVLVVSEYYAGGVQKIIAEHGYDCWKIGNIESGSGASWAFS